MSKFDHQGLAFSPIPIALKGACRITARLSTCDNACTTKQANQIGIHDGWALLLQCEICQGKWVVCNRCRSQRQPFKTRSQIVRHLNQKHKELKQPRGKKHRFSCLRVQEEEDARASAEAATINSPGGLSVAIEDELIDHAPMQVTGNDDEDSPELVKELSDWEESMQNLPQLDIHDASNLGFQNEASVNFFSYTSRFDDPLKRHAAGMEYLVKRSQLAWNLSASAAESIEIPRKEMELQLNYAQLAYQTSRTARAHLARVVKGAYELGCEHGFYSAGEAINENFNNTFDATQFDRNFVRNNLLPPWDIQHVVGGSRAHGVRLPMTEEEIRSSFLDSKYAIIKSLPIPTIHKEVSGHAMVDPIDCCRFCLSWLNCRVTFLRQQSSGQARQSIHHSSMSKRAAEILENSEAAQCKGFVSYLTFWSDDCDAGSTSMQGIANMWILLMTIATTTSEGNRLQNTFPIAIGKKGISHEPVYSRVSESLFKLMQQKDPHGTYYIGYTNKLYHGYFETFACLGDQPERRKENYHLGGSGTFGARFMVSANHLAMYERLRSCDTCKVALKQVLRENEWSTPIPVPTCDRCLNWDALVESELAHSPLPSQYPRQDVPNMPDGRLVQKDGNWFLKPFKVSYESMKQAIDTAHQAYCDNAWTIAQCESFLKVECLNAEYIERFREHAEFAKALNEAEGEDLQYLQAKQQSDPKMFEKVPYSSSWTRPGIELASYVEPIMHILFHGITNDNMTICQHVLKKHGSNAAFDKMAKKLSKQLIAMRTSWFKPREYKGGAFAGWICENYLALARVSLWFYQNVGQALLVAEDTVLPDPSTPQSQWRADQNKLWLEMRGLDTSGKAKELRERVNSFLLQDPVPEVLPLPDISGQDFEDIWVSLQNLLANAMSRPVNDVIVSKLDYCVRIYLSAFDSIDRKVPKPKKGVKETRPTVISRYNHLCLLNLPEVMEKFGPLPDLWEGKVQGEGYLPEIKALYHGGMRENWEFNMMQGLYRKKTLDEITATASTSLKALNSSLLKQRRDSYHIHSSVLEVEEIIDALNVSKKSPLSVILIQDRDSMKPTRLFAVVSDSDTVIELDKDDSAAKTTKFGLDYFKFNAKRGKNGLPISWSNDIEPTLLSPRIGFGLLLPLLDPGNDENARLFALVGSNWHSLSEKNNLEDLIEWQSH